MAHQWAMSCLQGAAASQLQMTSVLLKMQIYSWPRFLVLWKKLDVWIIKLNPLILNVNNSFLPLAQARSLEMSVTPLPFKTHMWSVWKSVGCTLKIYSESDHFLLISAALPWPKSSSFLSRISAVASFPCLLSCSWRDLIAPLLTTLQKLSISLSMKARGFSTP